MDGTLADTRRITGPALLEVAAQYGLSPPPPERVAAAIGISGDAFYRVALPDAPQDLLEEIAARTFALEAAMTRALGPALLFDGIAEVLGAMLAQGVRLAIASTGETEHVDSVLGHTGIRAMFDIVRCNSNDKAAMLGDISAMLPGYRLIMVGDKPKDSLAARAHGIASIGAGYGFSTPQELAGFDAIAGHPREIPSLWVAASTP